MPQHMAQVGEGLQVVGLGRLDQAVDGRAGLGPARGVGEQPVFPAHGEGPDGILGQGVADAQPPVSEVTGQQFPLVEGVGNGPAGQAVLRYPGQVVIQPGLEVFEHRTGQGLTLPGLLFGRQFFDALLDGIQLADLADGHAGLAHLLSLFLRRRGTLGLDELAPCMVPATDAGDVAFPAHPVVTGVAVGLECPIEALEQAQGDLLAA